MTDSLESLRNRVDGAVDLQAVVRTMKAMSAASIAQYESAVKALDGYYETVEQGLIACLKQSDAPISLVQGREIGDSAVVVVFGSDQGLVGQFNDSLAEFVQYKLNGLTGTQNVWVVGERMRGCLQDAGFPLEGCFNVPGSVDGVTPLVGDLLLATEHLWAEDADCAMYLIHHRPGKLSGQYNPRMHRLLPLDLRWQKALQQQPWLGPSIPEALVTTPRTLHALIREYLFVSLYQACAESLASENASRLLAMQRAEKNIEEMLAGLRQKYHHQRQESIDTELFDVLAGYESDN